MNESWEKHYQKVQEKKLPASITVAKAMKLFDKEKGHVRIASDLGCGTGIDTIALLKGGWAVFSIDKQTEAIEQLNGNVPEEYKQQLRIITGNFEDIRLPNVYLVNASFSLPFCRSENFASLWEKVLQSILPSGRFAGHFFGTKDSWATDPEKTFHTKEQVLNLFAGFEIEYFEEVEEEGKTIGGRQKYWHVFHVVSKRIV
jgi:tellurite methyltransferase